MIALGTPVIYHHRAAVARYGPPDVKTRKSWRLVGGVQKNGGMRPETDIFAKWPAQFQTVMVWPEEGSGIVTGLVRRQKVTSHRSYSYGEDWEPGYFDPEETFELYAVRHILKGQDYVLVPTWAAREKGR